MTGGSHCPQKRKLIGRSVQAETGRVKNTSCIDRVDAASSRVHVQTPGTSGYQNSDDRNQYI